LVSSGLSPVPWLVGRGASVEPICPEDMHALCQCQTNSGFSLLFEIIILYFQQLTSIQKSLRPGMSSIFRGSNSWPGRWLTLASGHNLTGLVTLPPECL